MRSARLVDLSHRIEDGLVTYPGLPVPRVRTHRDRAASRALYAPNTEFAITAIDMVANTGTYLDAPLHRFADGKDVAQLPLEAMADLAGIKVVGAGTALGPEVFAGVDVAGTAVLIATGWSRRFGTDAYMEGYPYLTEPAAELLVERGAALVGIDSPNVDDRRDGRRPVHTHLLGAGILIVEHLTGLAQLPASGFRFFAVPPPVRGLTSFPVRAFALLEAR